MTPIVAVKCYGYEWMTDLGLDEVAAARLMAAHGVDWALVQNTLDPLPESGVPQRQPEAYDEHRFRDALRDHGIKIFESTAVFHQPAAVEADASLRPVGGDGRPLERFDWYLGVSPHDRAYLARRADLLEEVVATHAPDGVFLSFIRFPGFWEAWTPAVERRDIRDLGFAAGSLRRFVEETGHELPDAPVRVIAEILQGDLLEAWTSWKCSVVLDSVRTLIDSARRVRPGVETLINGVAFPTDDRGDIARRILGQDLGAISAVAEHIETMVYHQILARDPEAWIPEVVTDLRPRVRGTLLPSVQTSPDYTYPPHLGAGRSSELPPHEVVDVLRTIAGTTADGVTVYHWTDVAADDLRGDGILARGLREYKEGEL